MKPIQLRRIMYWDNLSSQVAQGLPFVRKSTLRFLLIYINKPRVRRHSASTLDPRNGVHFSNLACRQNQSTALGSAVVLPIRNHVAVVLTRFGRILKCTQMRLVLSFDLSFSLPIPKLYTRMNENSQLARPFHLLVSFEYHRNRLIYRFITAWLSIKPRADQLGSYCVR